MLLAFVSTIFAIFVQNSKQYQAVFSATQSFITQVQSATHLCNHFLCNVCSKQYQIIQDNRKSLPVSSKAFNTFVITQVFKTIPSCGQHYPKLYHTGAECFTPLQSLGSIDAIYSTLGQRICWGADSQSMLPWVSKTILCGQFPPTIVFPTWIIFLA